MAETLPAQMLNATLVSREDINEELAIFRVRPDSGEVPAFEPGQYTTLGLALTPEEADEVMPTRSGKPHAKPKLLVRAYSIASPPKQRAYLEFFLVVVPDGALTPRLWKLREGDRLFMGPKITGKFTLDDIPPGKDLIMIATGTGLAPFLSMLHQYRHTNRWRRFVVIHGTRLAADLGYRAELERIAAEDPSVYYIPTVTREPNNSNWQGLRGRIHIALEPARYTEITEGGEITPEQCHVFLCGNPAMIEQVTAELGERGFVTKDRDHPEGTIHFESYW
ncbi:MAG: ferredoxin--NADP reductase [Phycisphaeraceae bacterium]